VDAIDKMNIGVRHYLFRTTALLILFCNVAESGAATSALSPMATLPVCDPQLDGLSLDQVTPGGELALFGWWGSSQTGYFVSLNRGGLNPVQITGWSEHVIKVHIPQTLSEGQYQVRVYCGRFPDNVSGSSETLDLDVRSSAPRSGGRPPKRKPRHPKPVPSTAFSPLRSAAQRMPAEPYADQSTMPSLGLKVDILGMTIVKNMPDTLILDVDVENHEDAPATMECVDSYHGQATLFWKSSNKAIQKGRQVYTASIGINSTAPDRHESDGILCQIFSVGSPRAMAVKNFPLKKTWKRPGAGGLAPHDALPKSKPIATGAVGPSKIYDIRVVNDIGEKIEVAVDYSYSGDHGDAQIYMDCDPYTENAVAPFGMLPAWVQVGRHTARAPLSSYGGTPDNTVSTTIRCAMDSRVDNASLAEKTISYRKLWKPK